MTVIAVHPSTLDNSIVSPFVHCFMKPWQLPKGQIVETINQLWKELTASNCDGKNKVSMKNN